MSKNLINSSVLVALAASLPATVANAGTVAYTDAGAFATAAAAQSYAQDWLVDFEEVLQGVVGSPYSAGDMSMASGGGSFYSFAGQSWYSWGSQVVGNLSEGGLTISSAGGVGAMGMDVYGYQSFIANAFDTFDYTVFDTSGGVIGSGSMAMDGFAGSYFGVVSDGAAIGSLYISGSMFGLGSATLVDNVSGWNVPAPSAAALLGLGGLVATRRRR